jgi:hypothetical protein
MPPLPGAQTTSVTRGLRFTAQASACSRPPEPKIKIFMIASLLFPGSNTPKGYLTKPGTGSQTGRAGDQPGCASYTDA